MPLCVSEPKCKGFDLSPSSAELSMIFGDGAGAPVVSQAPRTESFLLVEDILIAPDGNFAEELMVRAPGTANGARSLELHWHQRYDERA